MTSSTPLSHLERFGLSEWVLWRLQRGGLDEWCDRCRGSGFTVERPCSGPLQGPPCAGPVLGCTRCRHRCWVCKGNRLRPADVIRSEDFGDPASLAIAMLLDPTLAPDPRLRTDHHPAALGGNA